MPRPAALLNGCSAVVWALCVLTAPAWATGSDAQFDFDIPAQPLITALQLYGNVARKPALYRSEMLNGQASSPVRGRYAPQDALRVMLDGTGLVAEKFEHGPDSGFVLKPAPAAPAPRAAGLGRLAGYPALVQARVWQALCGNPATRPGEYRSLLRFQVDATGQLERPRLIGSTGDARRDAAVLATLQGVRMDDAPPPDFAQPVTMLLLPHAEGFTLRCETPGRVRAAGRP